MATAPKPRVKPPMPFAPHGDLAAARASSLDELAKYKELTARAVEVFGDEIKASLWLSSPSEDFDGKPPIQVASEAGYNLESLEPVLTRIEHGVYF